MDWASMMSSAGGGQNTTSSGQNTSHWLGNSSSIDFGTYIGGQTVSSGSRDTNTNTINWPLLIGVAAVTFVIARGMK